MLAYRTLIKGLILVLVLGSAADASIFSKIFSKKDAEAAKTVSSKTVASTKDQLTKIMAIITARQAVDRLRQQGAGAVNTSSQQALRQKLHDFEIKIQQQESARAQRLAYLNRDVKGLSDDLKRRRDAKSQDYKLAQEKIKKKESFLKLLSSVNKKIGNLLRNLSILDERYTGDYNKEFIAKFQALESEYFKANDELIAHWKFGMSDPEVGGMIRQEGEYIRQGGQIFSQLRQELQQSLSGGFQANADQAMKNLTASIKAANCSGITSIGHVNDARLRACFVKTLQPVSPILGIAACKQVYVPAARNKSQTINPDQPLDSYVACANSVINGEKAPVGQPGDQSQSVQPISKDKLATLVRLEDERVQLQTLLAKLQAAQKGVNQAGQNAYNAQKDYKAATADYAERMKILTAQLSKLKRSIQIARQLVREKLDALVDQLYLPPEDWKAKVGNALTVEGGADLVEAIIAQKINNSVVSGKQNVINYILGKLPGAKLVVELDPKKVMSSLRQTLADLDRDLSDIQRFETSQTYTREMDQALQRLHQSYPNFEFENTAGLIGKAWNWAKGFISTPVLGPKLPEGHSQLHQNMSDSNRSLGQQTQDLISTYSHEAEVLNTNVMQDIKSAGCPKLKGLNDLRQTTIAACIAPLISQIKPDQKVGFTQCQGIQGNGSDDEKIIACAKQLVGGAKVSPDRQLGQTKQRAVLALKTLALFSEAEAIDQQARAKVYPVNEAQLLKDLEQALINLDMFRNQWIGQRKARLNDLRQRHEIADQTYSQLQDELSHAQESIIQYLSFMNQIKDTVLFLPAMVMTHIVGSTAPVQNEGQEPLYKRVERAKKLVSNLQSGLGKLDQMISNHESDPRYLRDAQKYHQAVAQIRKTLEETSGAFAQLSLRAAMVIDTVNQNARGLECPSFQRFGDGRRGLQQCLTQTVGALQTLGRQVKDRNCEKLDPNSRSLEADLAKCGTVNR